MKQLLLEYQLLSEYRLLTKSLLKIATIFEFGLYSLYKQLKFTDYEWYEFFTLKNTNSFDVCLLLKTSTYSIKIITDQRLKSANLSIKVTFLKNNLPSTTYFTNSELEDDKLVYKKTDKILLKIANYLETLS